MSACIRCGSVNGVDGRYVRVLTETQEVPPRGREPKHRLIRETVVDIVDAAVCPACAGRAKMKAVLWTVPITLVMTAVMTVMSLFVARPNRNIRKEVAAMPTALPIVAGIIWLCGLSVYLPRPRELYAAEIVRKETKNPGNMVLVPLERRCYTRKERVTAVDIAYRTPVKTELAEKLIPLVMGQADDGYEQSLAGQTFVKKERAR